MNARIGVFGVLAAALLAAGIFFGFTADDAYIVQRYAWNLAHGAGLTFNPGEQVSALTSPAQAFVLAALVPLSAEPMGVYKILCVLAVLTTLAAVALRVLRNPGERIWFLLMTAASPFVTMWSVGGLETPLLLVVITSLASLCFTAMRMRTVLAAVTLASLAFVIRYDSVLFTVPVTLALAWQAFRAGQLRAPHLALLALPMLLPLAWLLFAARYFGDILPTSFYVKTPGFDLRSLLKGAGYELSAFVVCGAWLVTWPPRAFARWIERSTPAHRGLIVALCLVLLYGLSAGTKHMMFGYRLFAPYLPALIMALLLLREAVPPRAALLVTAALLQLGMFLVVWRVSVNPTLATPWKQYEYARLSLVDYAGFLGVLDGNRAGIVAHWRQNSPQPGRAPRIATYAAGRLPAAMPEAYVFEALVSYRHHCHGPWTAYADYIQLLTPRHGDRAAQLGPVAGSARLVESRQLRFDGTDESFEVWFNPHPLPMSLPSRVGGSCDAR